MGNELSLYGITEEFARLNELLEQSGGELAENEEVLLNQLSELLTSKVDACVGYHNSESDKIATGKERIKAMQEIVKSWERKQEKYESYIIACMSRLGKMEFNGNIHSIKLRKPSKIVQIDDEDKIPAEFIVVETVSKIRKKEIADAIKNGQEVAGASLVSGKVSLVVK